MSRVVMPTYRQLFEKVILTKQIFRFFVIL